MKTEKEKQSRWILLSMALFVQLFVAFGTLWAAPKTADEAALVVEGWLSSSKRPLGEDMGKQIVDVNSFTSITDPNGHPLFYVVNLAPTGFVIVSADDLIEPIIAFANNGSYEDSLDNPLGALVNHDLQQRVKQAKKIDKGIQFFSASSIRVSMSPTQTKWQHYQEKTYLFESESTLKNQEVEFIPNDIRVAPFTRSRWDQETITHLPDRACYNYYTLQAYWQDFEDKTCDIYLYEEGDPKNFPSGCVATAMAQLMFYHRYPQRSMGTDLYEVYALLSEPDCKEYCDHWYATLEIPLRGGNGEGGPYNWELMVPIPDENTTEAQRQAIGSLCHDVGLSVNMKYGLNGSSANTLTAADAFKNTFYYANAIQGYHSEYDDTQEKYQFVNIGSELNRMVNPNLDAYYPVLLGITGPDGGHAVLADGYGYHFSTLYHHLNLGWSGADDAWYNLPDIDGSYEFTSIYKCVYNVFPSGMGEIISGRLTNAFGYPLVDATVKAYSSEGTYEDVTDENGIYALVNVPSETTYSVEATRAGYNFDTVTVTTGTSMDESLQCGNVWGVDFESH